MKTLTLSINDVIILELLKQVLSGGLILQTPDGHEFVLAEINDFAHEIELTRKNKRLMKLLTQRGQQTETIDFEEAKAQLGLE